MTSKDKPTKPPALRCPCGTARDYEACCGPFISGSAKPNTAKELMRSRYSAYVFQAIDYLVATHRPKTGSVDRQGIKDWARVARWRGLDIVATTLGGALDAVGEVEFVARYAAHGQLGFIHERSRFERHDGVWFYIDGEILKNPSF